MIHEFFRCRWLNDILVTKWESFSNPQALSLGGSVRFQLNEALGFCLRKQKPVFWVIVTNPLHPSSQQCKIQILFSFHSIRIWRKAPTSCEVPSKLGWGWVQAALEGLKGSAQKTPTHPPTLGPKQYRKASDVPLLAWCLKINETVSGVLQCVGTMEELLECHMNKLKTAVKTAT